MSHVDVPTMVYTSLPFFQMIQILCLYIYKSIIMVKQSSFDLQDKEEERRDNQKFGIFVPQEISKLFFSSKWNKGSKCKKNINGWKISGIYLSRGQNELFRHIWAKQISLGFLSWIEIFPFWLTYCWINPELPWWLKELRLGWHFCHMGGAFWISYNFHGTLWSPV